MPLAIQVHHAVCDGFHVGRMLNELQQFLCMRPIRKPPLPARWPIH
ncbi:CatA-like O-acetyltransferase, partial [Roseisolibacter sp. H3M3-2]